MRILIAVDSFKGTLSSLQASKIIEKVFKARGHQVQSFPIADGGEGTIDSIYHSIGGEKKFVRVTNPRGKKIKTYYILKNDTAYLEYAKTSGLTLLKKPELNPLKASSFGFGELLNSVLKKNIKKIIIGIGGSATNDVGIGMLSALGVKFFNKKGSEINVTGAEILERIFDFDVSGMNPQIKNVEIIVLCDVRNPLYGIKGTTKLYSRQKGADVQCIKQLEKGVKHFAGIIEKKFHISPDFEGSGAAGGMGAALKIFLNAGIIIGIKGITEIIGIGKKIIDSDLIITGEGSLDFQSTFGKAPVGIAVLAKKHDKKVIAICGKIGKNIKELFKHGFDFIISSYGDINLSPVFLKRNAYKNLYKAAQFAADKINYYEENKNKCFIVNETKNFRNSSNPSKRH